MLEQHINHTQAMIKSLEECHEIFDPGGLAGPIMSNINGPPGPFTLS